MENQKSRIAKTIPYSKGTSRGITIQDIKHYYRAIVMKTPWYRHKNKQMDLWNWIKDPDINPHTYKHLTFDKEVKIIQWKKESIINKWCWHNWISVCRRMQINLYLSQCTKLKTKRIKDININPPTLKLIEDKVENGLEFLGTGDYSQKIYYQ